MYLTQVKFHSMVNSNQVTTEPVITESQVIKHPGHQGLLPLKYQILASILIILCFIKMGFLLYYLLTDKDVTAITMISNCFQITFQVGHVLNIFGDGTGNDNCKKIGAIIMIITAILDIVYFVGYIIYKTIELLNKGISLKAANNNQSKVLPVIITASVCLVFEIITLIGFIIVILAQFPNHKLKILQNNTKVLIYGCIALSAGLIMTIIFNFITNYGKKNKGFWSALWYNVLGINMEQLKESDTARRLAEHK